MLETRSHGDWNKPASRSNMTSSIADFDIASFLARTWLEGLPSDAVRDFAGRMQWRKRRAGQRLFRQGDAADGFYVVVSGRVRIFSEGGGHEALLNVLGPGKGFGEISLLDDGPRTHSAVCAEVSSLLFLPPAEFRALIAAHPSLQAHATRRVCLYLRMAFAALEDEVRLPLAPRLAKRLLLLAHLKGVRKAGGITIDQQLSQEDLANMLGTARQTVGKPLRDWQQRGWISLDYRRITLLDEAALARVATAPPAD